MREPFIYSFGSRVSEQSVNPDFKNDWRCVCWDERSGVLYKQEVERMTEIPTAKISRFNTSNQKPKKFKSSTCLALPCLALPIAIDAERAPHTVRYRIYRKALTVPGKWKQCSSDTYKAEKRKETLNRAFWSRTGYHLTKKGKKEIHPFFYGLFFVCCTMGLV